MTIEVAIRRLENISSHAIHTFGEEPFTMSLDDGIAIKKAIVSFEAWEKVKAEIVELQKDYQEYGWAYDDALEIIDKHLKEVEENESNV